MFATILQVSPFFGLGLLTLLAVYALVCSVQMATYRGPVGSVWIEMFGVKITPEHMFLLGLAGIIGGISGFVMLW